MNPSTALTRIKQTNDLKVSKELENRRHHDNQMASIATQETILKAFRSLISYLDQPQRVTKTAITNHLKEIGTPDALKVVGAVNDLHGTLKTHKNTDLSEVTNLLKSVLSEAKQIPKELVKIDIPASVEVSNQIDTKKELKDLLAAIKAIKLVAEAPVVNVPEPAVNVEAPDLKPLTKEMKAVEKAVTSLVFPELKTEAVEKLLKRSNKLLEEIVDKPSGGGGGGGGRVSPYSNTSDQPSFVTLNTDGSVPTNSPDLATRIDDVTTVDVTYIGKALIGSNTSSAAWQIAKLNTSSGLIKTWADANASYDNIWDNRSSLIYS